MVRVVGDAVQITGVGVLVRRGRRARGRAASAHVAVWRDDLRPVTMITAPALLLMTAIAACLGPAARAARVDPILTFRTE